MGCNQQKLLQIMSNPAGITEAALEDLQTTVTEYPYFQLGYTFIAKGKNDLHAPEATDSLHRAAIYAPSRSLLRKIFHEQLSITPTEQPAPEEIQSADWHQELPEINAPVSEDAPVTEEVAETVTKLPSSETDLTEQPPVSPEEKAPQDDSIYEELEENLKNLRANRQKNQIDNSDMHENEQDEDKKKVAEEDTTTSSAQKPEQTNKSTSTEVNTPYLLDYLKDLEPLQSERLGINQQRQRELIDKFMNSERDVRLRWRIQEGSSEDLSEKVLSTADNLVTENMADIYVRQGKTAKAVAIYKKLILKYPQKKTYFAEKIESLKEK